jgi:hypothetical protein
VPSACVDTSVPALSVASDGTPEMVTDRLSSASFGVATMLRSIAVFALPLAVSVVLLRSAGSATGFTVTTMSAVLSTDEVPSELVTSTCSVPDCSPARSCRPESWAVVKL